MLSMIAMAELPAEKKKKKVNPKLERYDILRES